MSAGGGHEVSSADVVSVVKPTVSAWEALVVSGGGGGTSFSYETLGCQIEAREGS